jgi:hypothetical protein
MMISLRTHVPIARADGGTGRAFAAHFLGRAFVAHFLGRAFVAQCAWASFA